MRVRPGWPKGAAEWWLKHARSGSVNGYVSPLALALAYAQVENKEATLKYLEQAYVERSPKLILLQNNPIFDFLHSDERYRAGEQDGVVAGELIGSGAFEQVSDHPRSAPGMAANGELSHTNKNNTARARAVECRQHGS